MDTVIKGYIGMYFLAIISFAGVGIIAASCRVRQADRFFEDALYEIEANEGSGDMIEEYSDRAIEEGFELSVDPEGEAVLTYKYSMPLFGFENSGRFTDKIHLEQEDEKDNEGDM